MRPILLAFLFSVVVTPLRAQCPNGQCPTVQYQFAPRQQYMSAPDGYRLPVGHTHTCPRCGWTWDHQANPGHTCVRCGGQQYVQDPVPRMVNVPAQQQQQPRSPPPIVQSGFSHLM